MSSFLLQRDNFDRLCKASVRLAPHPSTILRKIPVVEPFLQSTSQAQQFGVVLYFLGRTMPSSFNAWTAAVGMGKINSFVLYVKRFYYARCADIDTKYFLVNSLGIHGASRFAYVIPGFSI